MDYFRLKTCVIRKKVNQGRRREALEGSVVGAPFSLWVPFFFPPGDWGAGLAQARGPLTLGLISIWHCLASTVADSPRFGPFLGDPRAPHGWGLCLQGVTRVAGTAPAFWGGGGRR